MLLSGALIDRARRPLVPVALAAFAAAIVLPAFAGTPGQLALTLLAVGVASGALDVSINTSVSGLEARSGRRLMQPAHGLYSVGVVAGAVSVGIARSLGAGRLAVLACVAIVLLAAAALNRGEHREAASPEPRRAARRRPRLRVSHVLLVLGVFGGVGFVVEGGTEAWGALFLERDLGAPPAVSGLGPGLFGAAMAAGRFTAHAVSARLGDRVLLAAGSVLAAIGLAVAASTHHAGVALVGFALAGAGVSIGAPILFGAAGRWGGAAERGSAVATVTTIAYLGFVVGPPLMGGVAGAASLRVAFAMLAALALGLAVAAAAAFPDPTRRR
jgi:MFS family permease